MCSSAMTAASSPRRPAPRLSPSSTASIRTRCWWPAPPMWACGSPSSCAPCRRSSISAASPSWTGSQTATATGRHRRRRHLRGGAADSLAAIDPDLGELLRRLGSKQVRTAGTIGGNIANGSPIGDMPPALIALGATLELRQRRHPHDRAAGGFLHRLWQAGPSARRIRLRASSCRSCSRSGTSAPTRSPSASTRISRRCMGAFRLTLDGSRIARGAHRLRRHGARRRNAPSARESRR